MLSIYVKFWTERWTDTKTDRRTLVKRYIPDLSMQGHKNLCCSEAWSPDKPFNELCIFTQFIWDSITKQNILALHECMNGQKLMQALIKDKK